MSTVTNDDQVNKAIAYVAEHAPLGDEESYVDWLLLHVTVMLALARGAAGNDYINGYLKMAISAELALKLPEKN